MDCSAGLADGTTLNDYVISRFKFTAGSGTQKISLSLVAFLHSDDCADSIFYASNISAESLVFHKDGAA
jgi:hypothetical protein